MTESAVTSFTPDTLLEALNEATHIVVDDDADLYDSDGRVIALDGGLTLKSLSALGPKWGDFEITLADNTAVFVTWSRGSHSALGGYVVALATRHQKFIFSVEMFKQKSRTGFGINTSEDLPWLKVGDLREVLPYTPGSLARLITDAPSVVIIGHVAGTMVTKELGEGIYPWYEAIIDISHHNAGFINLTNGDKAKFYQGDVWQEFAGGTISIVFEVGEQYFRIEGHYSEDGVVVWSPFVEVSRQVRVVQQVTYSPIVSK